MRRVKIFCDRCFKIVSEYTEQISDDRLRPFGTLFKPERRYKKEIDLCQDCLYMSLEEFFKDSKIDEEDKKNLVEMNRKLRIDYYD